MLQGFQLRVLPTGITGVAFLLHLHHAGQFNIWLLILHLNLDFLWFPSSILDTAAWTMSVPQNSLWQDLVWHMACPWLTWQASFLLNSGSTVCFLLLGHPLCSCVAVPWHLDLSVGACGQRTPHRPKYPADTFHDCHWSPTATSLERSCFQGG